MIDIKHIFLKSVRLDGYGASKGFIGYFEQSGKYKQGIADTAVDYFLHFKKSYSNELIVLSSLHINSDKKLENNSAYVINQLVSAKMINDISYTEKFGTEFNSPDYEIAIEAIWNDVRTSSFSEYDPILIRNLLIAKMTIGGLYGHLFLISAEDSLAYYPHDYMGFGVIALNNNANILLGREFLKQAADLEGFSSVIEK
ncbi:hypothetical protein ACLBWS_17700 [Brucellaceae bacterium D45D]